MSSLLLHLTVKPGHTERRLVWSWRDLFSWRLTNRREWFYLTHVLPDGNIYYHFQESCLAFGPLQWITVKYTHTTYD